MIRAKKTRQLPTRGALNDLGRSRRTILGYSKATPIVPLTPVSSIQNLRNPRRSVK
jgi:hypothetical protein